MARIITFYVPISYRRKVKKQTASAGLGRIIPFAYAARRVFVSRNQPAPIERSSVNGIFRNHGILSLFSGTD